MSEFLDTTEATLPERTKWSLSMPKRLHEADGSGWNDRTGVVVYQQFTDCTAGFVNLTQRNLYALAATKAGGESLLSNKPGDIGPEAATHNAQVYKENRARQTGPTNQLDDLLSTVVIRGITEEQLEAAFWNLVAESDRLASTYGPEPLYVQGETEVYHI